jgi:hypothetical protein
VSRTVTSNTNVVVTITLPPYARVWFDRRRSWHTEKVSVHGETRFVADGTKAHLSFILAGTARVEVGSADATIKKGRLCGENGKPGLEHELAWSLPAGVIGARGLIAELSLVDYKLAVDSPLLELDLAPYVLSG